MLGILLLAGGAGAAALLVANAKKKGGEAGLPSGGTVEERIAAALASRDPARIRQLARDIEGMSPAAASELRAAAERLERTGSLIEGGSTDPKEREREAREAAERAKREAAAAAAEAQRKAREAQLVKDAAAKAEAERAAAEAQRKAREAAEKAKEAAEAADDASGGGGGAAVEDAGRIRAANLTTHLKALGYLAARNREDRTMVRAFQAAEGLTVDGMYGPTAARRILSAYGIVPVSPLYWSKTKWKQQKAELSAYVRGVANSDPARRAEYDRLLADIQRS